MKILEGAATKIKVPEGKRDVLVFDDSLPGFGVRKFASGKASFSSSIKSVASNGSYRLARLCQASRLKCAVRHPTFLPRLA